MNDLQREREDLIVADRHLAAGERRVTEQLALIQIMTQQGYDTTLAYDLLRSLEETLVTWQEHRQLILDAITRKERSVSPLRAPPGQEAPGSC